MSWSASLLLSSNSLSPSFDDYNFNEFLLLYLILLAVFGSFYSISTQLLVVKGSFCVKSIAGVVVLKPLFHNHRLLEVYILSKIFV